MGCIVCFLDDQFQEKLRNFAHSNSEKFEETLKKYKSSFFNELEFLVKVKDCIKHQNLQEPTIGHISKYSLEFKKNYKSYVRSFDSLIEIYKRWIMGEVSNSESQLLSYLKDHSLLNATDKIDNSILYRGRWSKVSLNRDDMFHIPFNKRYLISNQRYSISGQPLLYFGLSPIDVVHELRSDIDNIENIYFSSFLHIKDKFKIFNLTNEFPTGFTTIDILSSDGLRGISGFDNGDISQFINLFILTQMCSFKRSKVSENAFFSEEYVIPQMLTSVLRSENYDGILFSSTRTKFDSTYSKALYHVNMHRENLALFTKYREDQNIDLELRDKFICSKPLEINDLIEIDETEFSRVRKQIGKIINAEGYKNPFSLDITKIFGANALVDFENFFLKGSSNDTDIEYFQHQVGKLHLMLMYQILIDFRNEINLPIMHQ